MDRNSFLTGLRVGMQLRIPPIPQKTPSFMRPWTADPQWLVHDGGTVLETNSGSRTPITKRNDGWAICCVIIHCNDGQYGGNWTNTFLISPESSAADMSMPNAGSTTVVRSYRGMNWTIVGCGHSLRYGGASDANSRFPVLDWEGAQAGTVNGAPMTEETFLTIMQSAHVRLA